LTQLPPDEAWCEETKEAYTWGGFSVYDNPMQAALYGSITSPQYLGHDKWEAWKKEHRKAGRHKSPSGE